MSGVTNEAVLKALSRVEDPDLHRDLVSLGMIEEAAQSDPRIEAQPLLAAVGVHLSITNPIPVDHDPNRETQLVTGDLHGQL